MFVYFNSKQKLHKMPAFTTSKWLFFLKKGVKAMHRGNMSRFANSTLAGHNFGASRFGGYPRLRGIHDPRELRRNTQPQVASLLGYKRVSMCPSQLETFAKQGLRARKLFRTPPSLGGF
jgi:hypothetical protein